MIFSESVPAHVDAICSLLGIDKSKIKGPGERGMPRLCLLKCPLPRS